MPRRFAVRMTRQAISPRLAIRIFLNISDFARSLGVLRPHFPDHIWSRVLINECLCLGRGLLRSHWPVRYVKQQVQISSEPVRNDRKSIEAQEPISMLRALANQGD